jgi:CRISPR-associated protein Csd1
MILQALIQLAENEKLIADPDFEFKPVAWVVRLKDDGGLIAVEDNRINLNEGQTDKRGKPVKPKWVGRDVLIPLFPNGRAGTKPPASFLVDMAKFIFGIDAGKETSDPGKLRLYVERFRQRVADCEAATADPSVAAVRGMLDRVLSGELAVKLSDETGPSDLFMFRVGRDDVPVHAMPAAVAYWKQCRAAPMAEDAGTQDVRHCVVTGVPIFGDPPLFPLIKNVPGGGTMGSGLLPFNGPSSRTWSSYGLEGNDNAPVSRQAAEAAATALNRLLDPRPTNGAGEPLPARRIKLSEDTVVVFWSPSPEANDVLNVLGDILDHRETTADVASLIASYRTGTFRSLKGPAKFYALTLTGTTGRVIVRDWLESSVAEIQSNLGNYFDGLRLVRPAGPGRLMELDDSSLPTLRDVKLAAYRELDDVPAPFGREWLRVAWGGPHARVPSGVVMRVISRIQIALAHGDNPAQHAFSILKLFTSREGDPHMRAFVNEDHPNVAYHCGRLLATLDFAQQRGLGETNTSNVRRMLGAIMTAPALYLGRIRRLTEVAYLPKMEGDWAAFLRDRIQSVSARLGDEIPRLLQMRDQSTFFLGFDQERTFLQTHPPSKYRWQTSAGVWVMSRGERDVVESLVKLLRPFIYEPGLALAGDRMRYPDFMIPAEKDADRIFIEYLGMMDKPEYADRWKSKQEEYAKIGLLPIGAGGGRFGKLIVLDHINHPDKTFIYNELHKHLGQPLADDDETTSQKGA